MIETTTNHDEDPRGPARARNASWNMLGADTPTLSDPNRPLMGTQDVTAASLTAGESALHRTIGATLLSALNLFLKVGTNFVLLPMTLGYLGREQYGIWIVLQSFATYLALSEMGIGQTVCNFQNVALARSDHDGVNRILTTTFWLYCIIGGSVWILFAMLMGSQPVESWLLKAPSSAAATHFRLYLFLAGSLALLRVPLTIFPVTLMGLRQTVLRQIIDTTSVLMLLAGTVVTLVIGGKLLALLLVTNLLTLAPMVLGYPLARSRIAAVEMSSRYWDPKLLWPIFSNSLFFFLYGLGLLFQRIGGNLLAGKFAPLAQVPSFFVLLTLFRIVGWSLADTLSQSAHPYIILLNARGEKDRVVMFASLCTKFTFGLAAVYAVLVWLYADVGIHLWLGPGMFLGYTPLAYLAGSFLIEVLFLSTNNFMRALNDHRGLSITMATYAGLSLLLGTIGAKWWTPDRPLDGLCFGLLMASVLGQLLPLPFLCRQWLGLTWMAYGRTFLALPGLTLLCILIPLILFRHRAPAWDASTFAATACTLLIASTCLWTTLGRKEKAWITQAIRRLQPARTLRTA